MTKLEERRLKITEVVMKRHFIDELNDIGQLILDIETLIEEELNKVVNGRREFT